jgi:hypothetical protein
LQKRCFIRHPADVPITVEADTAAPTLAAEDRLRDIGIGGMSFESSRAFAPGMFLTIGLPVADPGFSIRVKVAWCRAAGDHMEVGVEFAEHDKVFRARMVEQICHVEHYKKQVFEEEHRALSDQEAALEWIQKYAEDFPRTTDDT